MSLVVAQDLEGTLISNAISAFPRPGLKQFIASLQETADRVVMFTTVPEGRARDLLQIKEAEGELPRGFAAAVEFVRWTGKTKDLTAVNAPASATVLLVDDQPSMIHPGQEENWIRIAEFMPPFDQDDGELARVTDVIRMNAASWFPATRPEDVYSSMPYKGTPRSLEDMDAGIIAEAKRRADSRSEQ